MDAAAFDAEHYTEIDGHPFDLRLRIAVCAPTISLVVIANYVEELGGVFFETITICTNVRRSGAHGTVTINIISCVGY